MVPIHCAFTKLNTGAIFPGQNKMFMPSNLRYIGRIICSQMVRVIRFIWPKCVQRTLTFFGLNSLIKVKLLGVV